VGIFEILRTLKTTNRTTNVVYFFSYYCSFFFQRIKGLRVKIDDCGAIGFVFPVAVVGAAVQRY
jgi:hypothetical protein